MRTLLYVPIVHTIYETMPPKARKKLLRSEVDSKKHEVIGELIFTCWMRVRDDIARFIRALPPSHPRVRVWRDGLLTNLRPRTSARFPPRWYPLHAELVWLQRLGAHICATEHPQMVVLQYLAMILHVQLPRHARQINRVDREIMALRDDYGARNVLDGLGEGETGILFMGADHHVDRILRKADPAMRIIRITHFKDVVRRMTRILATPRH